MNLDTLQQLVRIALLAVGGALFGDGFGSSEQSQMLVGGVMNLLAFGWWAWWEYRRRKKE